MEKCIEIGELQAFLDGETDFAASENIARHVAVCDACAAALAEAEDESAFAFSLIEQELNTLVPTGRLWTKINDSIGQSKKKTVRESVFANFKLLFANRAIAAFAGFVIVAGIFAFVKSSQLNESAGDFVQNKQSEQSIAPPQTANEAAVLPFENELVKPIYAAAKKPSAQKAAGDYRIIKTANLKPDETRRNNIQPIQRKRDFIDAVPAVIPAAENLPGEETYIKTIAALEKTVDGRKDEILKPTARFSFEKDLAVANDAIVKMKSEVVKNPKNAAAKQVLMASYQNKIELLAGVAEKNDLMASLR